MKLSLIRCPLALYQHLRLDGKMAGYSDENGQWLCRESGRRYAVKTAAIPVKTARV